MALGSVTVNDLNLAQGTTPEIERKALFIGTGSKNIGDTLSLNTQSDLDELLGVNNSSIKTQVRAAKLNGGAQWEAFAHPIHPVDNWREALDQAMTTVSPELVVLCNPDLDRDQLQLAQQKAEEIRTTLARRVIILLATPIIDSTEFTWTEYESQQINFLEGINSYRVAVVPLLHSNDIGVLAGRLCNASVSIADSPMRVKTGPVIGLGPTPRDVNDVLLPSSTLAALDRARFTVIQNYVDYPGTYFGDGNLLDAPGGDFQKIEHLRIVDKAARAVYLRAITLIADRSVNTSPLSQAATKSLLMRPLRDMSKATVFNGRPFPGEIKPPSDDAIALVWHLPDRLEVYLKVTPVESPKTIVANLVLNFTNES